MPQMALNLWVVKIYGISDPIQLLSTILAYLGFSKIVADRLCFIRNGADLGMASWSFVKTFFDGSIPIYTGLIGLLLALSENCMPAWTLLLGSLGCHPTLILLGHRKIFSKKTKDVVSSKAKKSSSKHYTDDFNKTIAFLQLLLYILLMVSKILFFSDMNFDE